MDEQETKQLRAYIEGSQQSMAHFQGATEQQLKNIWGELKETKEWAIRTDERINHVEAKMLNGYSHRLEALEVFTNSCNDHYVRVDTFNQANVAIREQMTASTEKTTAVLNQVLGQMKQFKWFVGVLSTLFLGLVGLVVAL